MIALVKSPITLVSLIILHLPVTTFVEINFGLDRISSKQNISSSVRITSGRIMYLFRLYAMPYLIGYDVWGMLAFPLESDFSKQLYQLFY